jgi:hypothetical protein
VEPGGTVGDQAAVDSGVGVSSPAPSSEMTAHFAGGSRMATSSPSSFATRSMTTTVISLSAVSRTSSVLSP